MRPVRLGASTASEHQSWSLNPFQIKCPGTQGEILNLHRSLGLEDATLKALKALEVVGILLVLNKVIFYNFPDLPGRARVVSVGISHVWTSIALWWPADKVHHRLNSEQREGSLPASFGGPREIVAIFYSGPSTDWLNHLLRCPSAQERATENLAEGLGLRAFVRAAPVPTSVTSAVPEIHPPGPRLTPPTLLKQVTAVCPGLCPAPSSTPCQNGPGWWVISPQLLNS